MLGSGFWMLDPGCWLLAPVFNGKFPVQRGKKNITTERAENTEKNRSGARRKPRTTGQQKPFFQHPECHRYSACPMLEAVSKPPLEPNFGVAELDRGAPSPRIQRQVLTYPRMLRFFDRPAP
jgi:hypothetical protein